MNELLIQCRGLSKSYGHKLALDGLTLEVGRGRIVGLLGPNGSGKTTLLKLLCGLLQPTAGELTINGQRVGPETKAAVSYLPDRMYFADWMRATDLFDLFRDFYRDFDYEKALAMCSNLGVEPRDRLKSMSKGTKEKVQLVLVMARKAQLYLLDEPIAGVDPAARDFILRTILTNYNEAGTAAMLLFIGVLTAMVVVTLIFVIYGVDARFDLLARYGVDARFDVLMSTAQFWVALGFNLVPAALCFGGACWILKHRLNLE
jgi:ABC-2 type transport system ATP-binding protein